MADDNQNKDTNKPSEIRDINNLWLNYERNPDAFSSEHKEKLAQWNREIIEKVATGKYKLDKHETDLFRTVLDHAPKKVQENRDVTWSTFGPVMPTKEQERYNDAAQILYNVENGIVKKSFREKVSDLANKGKAVSRLGQRKFRHGKEQANALIGKAKQKAIDWKDKKQTQAKEGLSNGWERFKNGAKKVWGFTQKVAKTTYKVAKVSAVAVATPFVVGYKGVKAGYEFASKIANNISNRYQDAQKRKAEKAAQPPTNKKEAEKMATKRDLNTLNAEQIKAAWGYIDKMEIVNTWGGGVGIGESEGRNRMAQKAESVLEAVRKRELEINDKNAPQIAAWLAVNRDIQDKVNKNRVVEKNKRNDEIAALLEAFGIKDETKTKETQEQSNSSPTISAQSKEEQKQVDPVGAARPEVREQIEPQANAQTQQQEPLGNTVSKAEATRNPLNDLSTKKWDALNKAYDRMEKQYTKNMKSGRMGTANEILKQFDENLTAKGEKGQFGLTEEQATAFRTAKSGKKGIYPEQRDNTQKGKTTELDFNQINQARKQRA